MKEKLKRKEVFSKEFQEYLKEQDKELVEDIMAGVFVVRKYGPTPPNREY